MASLAELALALSLVACASSPAPQVIDTSSGARVRLERATEPERDFAGIYWSPQTGALELVRTPLGVRGHYSYRMCGCQVTGDVQGESAGNFMRARITERSACAQEERTAEGTLYWVAPIPPETRPRLFGRRSYFVDMHELRGVPATERRDAGVWTLVPVELVNRATEDNGEHCP